MPNILSAGNRIGMIKNDFSEEVKFKFGSEKICSSFILYPIIARKINDILNEIKRVVIDKGVS